MTRRANCNTKFDKRKNGEVQWLSGDRQPLIPDIQGPTVATLSSVTCAPTRTGDRSAPAETANNLGNISELTKVSPELTELIPELN